ncbi:MAG: lytic transglycosylase domain-containing protein [Spirochaetales bacterium]|nr:lytic transglycosylase domain-containing protein [Spirochaetales bacterium]
MKHKNHIGDEAQIIVEHQYYKPDRLKKFKRVKNVLLFGLYIGAVAVIVNFASGSKIKEAYAGNIEKVEEIDKKNIIDMSSLSVEEKLKLKYYAKYTRNDEIAKLIYRETHEQNIDIHAMLALIKAESDFNPKAVNYNKNGSIDRGLCQLNSFVFSDIKIKDFFDPAINIHYGAEHFKWCLDQADNNLVKALALYNAGYGSVTKTKVGERTLNYIQTILDTMHQIKIEEQNFLDQYKDLLR